MNRYFFPGLLLVLILFIVIRYFYYRPSVINGEFAPNIEGVNNDGRIIGLEELKGQYVLIHFWGSWCGTCRKENKELVNIYEETRNKKYGQEKATLEFFSVGVEHRESSWERVIEQDGLVWENHIIALDLFKNPILESYGIRSIPNLFLVDPKGIIIGVGMKPQELKRILEKREQKD
jgi:thiol-disulfide isomerase/thioredoxin